MLWAKRAWWWGAGLFMQVKELMEEEEGIFAGWLPRSIAAQEGRSTERSLLEQDRET